MSKWGLCLISIGAIFVMVSENIGYNSIIMILTGLLIALIGVFMIFKSKTGSNK